VFVGDVANATYHQGRAAICRELGATVINSRDRAGRLAVEARMPALYRTARYVLSMSPRAPAYTSVRTYSILACGGLMLLHRFPDADRLFRDGEHAILFNKASELRGRIEELDQDEARRERIAAAGRELHASKHTVTHRVLSICRTMTGIAEENPAWL
jgi:spore maturation protein CgeB